MQDYRQFLAGKAIHDPPTGLEDAPAINEALFPFQRDIVAWALRRGRAAIWADCGLGKTPMQLEWAKHVPGRVLILAPLAVAQQTIREGEKFGIDAVYARKQDDAGQITVTNYEMLSKFDPDEFTGVVLDESSILKAYDGKTRTEIIESFRQTPFRLACTATPSPNDMMELGNHSEFLGIMSRTEMLATFFCHDGGDTSQWRLKGHAERDFWRWLCSWAVSVRKPSDLGYDDEGFALPELVMHDVCVRVDEPTSGMLFPMEASQLQDRLRARRETIDDRVSHTAAIVNATDEAFICWCNLNAEAEAIRQAIPGAVEIRGSDSPEQKEKRLLDFSEGRIRVLVTKPSIAGYGLNWQHCHNAAFVGLSDSYEDFYQAVRRCWRFGQKQSVNVYVVTAETEGAVVANIRRKESQAAILSESMVSHMREMMQQSLRGGGRTKDPYEPKIKMEVPKWLVA
jgi:hypothetical protein